ncbi:MAG TPA: hypothetical protein VGK59_23495, partial [Ohtaekwangia sp.]
MKKVLPFFLFLFILIDKLAAQEVLDNNAPSIKWFQVNTPHFRVMFPEGYDAQAQRMANTLEYIHDAEAKSLGSSPRKISVLLQNQSSLSNGFVTQLPRKSEFYTMPSQDYNFQGTNDWLDMLASHEYRHIVQYQHALRGFNRALYYLFGSFTFTGMSQAAAPDWFFEGDAVATETAFTGSGRGRIPNFDLVFRTNLLEGRTFNYHKQYLRSYKHYIPNEYVLGYHMVSYLRRKTNDPEIWGKITARSWSVPFVPFAFSNAIKNKSGMYVTGLYNDMAATLKKEWQDEVNKLTLTSFEKVNPRKTSAYTDYQFPQPLDNGGVLVLKHGIGDIDQFVVLKDGKENKVFTPGFRNDAAMLSTAFNTVIWNEFGYNPRWRVKNYSLIKVYDIDKKKKRTLGGKHNRYGSAALSPQGDKVVTVQSNTNYEHSIVVLEIFTGKVIKTFPNPENNFYAMPRWSDDGKHIVALKTTREGKTISIFNWETDEEKDILPVSKKENVGHPVMIGNHIIFNSPATGIDNIHAVDITTGKRYIITSSKYGAYNPAVSRDGKTLYYNDQTKDGLDVVKIPYEPSSWLPFIERKEPKTFFQHLVDQEGRPNLFDSIPAKNYTVTKYSKLKGMINPHSWGLVLTNDYTRISAGVTSKDLLNTTMLDAGYVYDINEGTGYWEAGLSYQGWFPVINLTATTGDREDTRSGFGNTSKMTWEEQTLTGGLSIPLLLTNSKYSQELTFGNDVGITAVSSFDNTVRNSAGEIVYEGSDRTLPVNDSLTFIFKDQLNGNLLYNRLWLSYDHVLKTSYRDFLYRWGQTLDFELYNTPYQGGDFEGRLMAIRTAFYFPGLFKHHYLYARVSYQKSLQGVETDIYTFRNRIPKPRGYSYPSDEKFLSISSNYALPLWYPDIALGPVLNIQRIKLSFFYDYGKGTGRNFFYHNTENAIYYRTT